MQNISHGYMKHAVCLVNVAYRLQILFLASITPAPLCIYYTCWSTPSLIKSNNFVLKVDFSLKVKICVLSFCLGKSVQSEKMLKL